MKGNFFSPANAELITLFRNIGIKHIRVGGGTVDGSGRNEHCVMPTPTHSRYRQSVCIRASCRRQGHLLRAPRKPRSPALIRISLKTTQRSLNIYGASTGPISIAFPSATSPMSGSSTPHPGQDLDPVIYETTPGVAGSAYPSYIADWQHFAEVIHKAVPDARFSGPDTAVSDNSSFTPNPADGVSWTVQFARDREERRGYWPRHCNTTTYGEAPATPPLKKQSTTCFRAHGTKEHR